MSNKTNAVLVNVFTNQHFALNAPSTMIGRASSSDIILKDILVSRSHAVISCEADEFFIEDQESTNGTVHNDNFVIKKTKLKPGDRIRVGTTWFSFALVGDTDDGIITANLRADKLACANEPLSAVAEFRALLNQYRKQFLFAKCPYGLSRNAPKTSA